MSEYDNQVGEGVQPPAKVLVIGAAGYAGTHTARAFLQAGYQVTCLQRPGGKTIPSRYPTVPGDLTDPASLTEAARGFDLVVNLGAILDEDQDLASVDGLLASGVPLIYTSGSDVSGEGYTTEDTVPIPHPFVGWRDKVERRVIDGGGIIVRPGLIYGNGGGVVGDRWIPLRDRVGAGVYLGEPGVRWGAVHVEDLAWLYVAIAKRAAPRTYWYGVSENIEVDVIADVVGGGKTMSWSLDEEPPPEIAIFAGLFRLDQECSAVKTRHALGWNPVHTSLVEALRHELRREPKTDWRREMLDA
ncbi:NAD-dependent epimerase/dehydratase family protein [Hamadaea sp. NPDC050747]|uniref:NAD-dependent epimerase/dehydratase family protein n=1 Tax=Hamadaea sp. NPDC050747 TaxID=3155789 RepID=UPI0033EE550F